MSKLVDAIREVIPKNIPENGDVTVATIIRQSQAFAEAHMPHPIQSNICQSILQRNPGQEALIHDNIDQTYPLVHEDVLIALAEFIALKRRHGSQVEKELYQDMDILQLVDRVARSHLVCHGFDNIGSDHETMPYVLRDYISYDEMKLSALLATCSPTIAINQGQRRNKGVIQEPGTFIEHGYIVGVVGTRMMKLSVMEAQDIRINGAQNTPDHPFYGPTEAGRPRLSDIFAKLYGIPYFPTYTETKALLAPDLADKVAGMTSKLNPDHFVDVESLEKGGRGKSQKLQVNEFFNRHVYEERIRITAETFLIEANERARKAGKSAYVHVVGLGLGVWKLLDRQHQWYVDVFGGCFQRLKLEHVSDVDFSWIPVASCLGVKDQTIFPDTNIQIHISRRDPFETLANDPQAQSKVIVSSWAYDSNSYPGNEYWKGSLSSSGDPAAACATQVPELHNPLINPKMRGSNLHVALREGRILAFRTLVAEGSKSGDQ
eukprot:maker-scaffold626_size122949-snap-gene-0.23 protein:Tk11476 transcript:maker-scaffold626_size122949-snap-gene-0.23-mRNA-1 annotation:"hypothetical protein EAI_16569"